MLTRTIRQVEPDTEYPDRTFVDVIGGDYQGHIGRVKRYTAKRVVITLYPTLGGAGAKRTINTEVTIKKTNVRVDLEPESTHDDESLMMKRYNIHGRKLDIENTSDESMLMLLASLVASQINQQEPDCTTSLKKNLFILVNELIRATHPD
jgi:hypothetical protein